MKRLWSALLILLMLGGIAGGIVYCEGKDDVPLVILDSDMGFWNDDTLALSLLLKAEEAGDIRILGITLEGGNNFINADYENYGEVQTAAYGNTKDFLDLAGREDIPVYCGTDYPMGFTEENIGILCEFYESLRYLQDSDSYGAVHFYKELFSGELTDRNDARDFLLSCAKEYPGRVTIIAIGPTMNIARAVEADDSFAENIAAVYYMAGAFSETYEAAYADGESVQAVGGANITPFAEYNACFDALALKTCLTAGFPMQVILPGEINAPIDAEVVSRLKAENTDGDQIVTAWLDRYAAALPDYPYWDPVTAAAFLHPDNLQADKCHVTICTDRNDPLYAETTALSDDEYDELSDDEKAQYGEAFVGRGYDDFWDIAVGLLCR